MEAIGTGTAGKRAVRSCWEGGIAGLIDIEKGDEAVCGLVPRCSIYLMVAEGRFELPAKGL